MLFNSLDFFIFLPIVLGLYFSLRSLPMRQFMLVCASFFFYMYWNIPYASIIVFFILLDYTAGRLIESASTTRRRKAWLVLSLSCNLGVLAIFKYFNFFMGTLVDAGVIQHSPSLGLLLPLGISFHTFQTMSYTVDVYRGVIPAERSLLRFAMYVSFFPQLVAGPIERARDMLPQIPVLQSFDWDDFVAGGQRILNGFVKKVVLADNLAPFVNQVYSAPAEYSGLSALLATWCFAWQIFFDFSGYSDIAIGTARIMGFRFVENFDMPYISASIREFWRRWHMSLSTWLRDYLYISLGGNRKGKLRTYGNLLLTMLLGGLWHGASWNFVIWGGMHGAWLAFERLVVGDQAAVHDSLPQSISGRVRRALAAFLVFNGVCVTWIFFRATTLHAALDVLRQITQWSPGASIIADFAFAKLLIVALTGGTYFALAALLRRRPRLGLAYAVSALAVLAIVLFGAKSNEFIYFVF